MAWTVADIPPQSGRVAVVTGGNGGLGLETVRGLAGAGAEVVIAARDQERAAAAVADVDGTAPDASLEVVELDLASQASVRAAAGRIAERHPRIDLLVNNAGVMGIPERRTVDGFEMQLAVDHLGHWTLTALLLPALLRAPAARIVTVTSFARLIGRPIDPGNPHLEGRYGPWRSYDRAKRANFEFALGLHRRLRDAGAPAASLVAHPGLANTDLQAVSVRETQGGLTQRFWLAAARTTGISPADGARSLLRAATDPGARSGELYGPLFVARGAPVRKPILRRPGLERSIARLWHASERETGVRIDL
ncbi:MAG TPA: SDR family NAD(P)-dependent oxidoreductase [Solirubrobacterales bacterium]|nr:SDR family NAD(P)-dependent oxidoreductase [Solirubrobacterales bacterium]